MQSSSLDISDLCTLAADFTAKLDNLKAQLGPLDFPWYPYNTLSGLEHLNTLLTGPYRQLLSLAKDKPILDVGCQDGEISLLLSSLGWPVHAIDYPPANHNAMRGVRTLREALNATSVRIEETDLDNQFKLTEQYGLAFFLGTLYHLKNPFYVLEELSRHVDYCVVSTRTARFLPDRTTPIDEWPIGYLLTAAELNDDDSNFWIFSECALRRLFARANWIILASANADSTSASNPSAPDGDERAFYLIASRQGSRGAGLMQRWQDVELLAGWHSPEGTGWRWTMRKFGFRVAKSPCYSSSIRIDLFVPQLVLDDVGGCLGFAMKLNGDDFDERTFTKSGEYVIERQFVPAASGEAFVGFDCELTHALAPDASDARERGIIVARIIVT